MSILPAYFREAEIGRFKACLGYTGSSRPTWAIGDSNSIKEGEKKFI